MFLSLHPMLGNNRLPLRANSVSGEKKNRLRNVHVFADSCVATRGASEKRALDSGAGAPAEPERERERERSSERWRFSHSSVGAGEGGKGGVRGWGGRHDGNKTYAAAQILNSLKANVEKSAAVAKIFY